MVKKRRICGLVGSAQVEVRDRPAYLQNLRSIFLNHGNFGNLSKSGFRFSKNACLPSCASSER